MLASKQISLDCLGIQGSYAIRDIPSIEAARLPSYNFKERILVSGTLQTRASLTLTEEFDHGSYGMLYKAVRDKTNVLVKRPRMAEMNLLQEGILQHLAHTVVEQEGIPWAVPRVYDVFTHEQEVWFSMDRVYGSSLPDWLASSSVGDREVTLLLAQSGLILATLESRLHLDHRDLKLNNLVIVPSPCTIRVSLEGSLWTLHCPFQVVVLDFGFACLGSEMLRGIPLLNLGDGVLPPMDPCPKEGRDMFHLLVSLLGLPVFRETISQRLHDRIDKWLCSGTKAYGLMARRWSAHSWSYLVSSQPSFSIPACCPLAILQDLLPELKGSLSRA